MKAGVPWFRSCWNLWLIRFIVMGSGSCGPECYFVAELDFSENAQLLFQRVFFGLESLIPVPQKHVSGQKEALG